VANATKQHESQKEQHG